MPDGAPDAPDSGAAAAFQRLFDIVRRLRAPDGCPWDREQSPETLRPALIEETWEAVGAIEAGDHVNLREELGDLYLIVTMMAWMRQEEGAFTVRQVLEGIGDKLVRRHPHVFGSAKAGTSSEVLRQWERIKASEHVAGHPVGSGSEPTPPPSIMDRVSRSLPPLERSLRLQKKAAKVGFDWPGPEPVWEKIKEEMRELQEAIAGGTPATIEREAGDVLFSVINLLRLLHVDPGVALQRAGAKFERRFREMERRLAESNVEVTQAGMDRLDAEWNLIKADEAAAEASGDQGASGDQEAPETGEPNASK
jgi:MazG family protein